jgi:hypothetical protein
MDLPTFTSLLRVLLLLQTKLAAWKQGHCAEKASAGKEFRPEILLRFRRMGRAARAPGAGRPYFGKPLFSEKERPTRPIQETICASWFFRAMPLLPGRAWPEIQSPLHLLGEK